MFTRFMFTRLWEKYFFWDTNHPLYIRESVYANRQIPRLIEKLSKFGSLFSYAAAIHLALFVFSLVNNRIQTMNANMPPVSPFLVPFLTPMGTPLAVGILHTFLYWFMMIGMCNYTVNVVGRDLTSGTWDMIRLTSLPRYSLLAMKSFVVLGAWQHVLRFLVIIRFLAYLLLPVAVLLSHPVQKETVLKIDIDIVGGIIFVMQPLVDALCIMALSMALTLLVRHVVWAKIAAYGIGITFYGFLGGTMGTYMMFQTTLGNLGNVFVPLHQWGIYLNSILMPVPKASWSSPMLMMALLYIGLPLLVTMIMLRIAYQTTRRS